MNVAQIFDSIGVAITALATIVLALLTGRYVKLTHGMLQEARAAKRPNVYVDLEFSSSEVKFVVGNSGLTPAMDIKFRVEDDIPWRKRFEHDERLCELAVIKNGVSYLAPGRVLKYTAGSIARDEKKVLYQSKAEIKLSYIDEEDSHFEREFVIHMSQYAGILFESFTSPEAQIATAIRDAESNRRFSAKANYGELVQKILSNLR